MSLPLPATRGAGRGEGLALSTLASLAHACSGDGAVEAIRLASLTGTVALLASIVATVFTFRFTRTTKKLPRILAVVLLVLHPTFWLSALSGDCGQSLLIAAPVMALFHLGVLGLAHRLRSA